MKLQSYYPITLSLDDPETGDVQDVRVRIARMTLEQASAFRRAFYRNGNPLSSSQVARTPAGDEQEHTETGGFVLDADAIRLRRLAEMTADQRAAFLALEDTEAADADRFLADTITRYVSVEPGQLEDDDGPIVTGADVLRVFGARADVLTRLLVAVQSENTWSAAAKKVWRSRSASGVGSDGRPMAPVGPTPAATVDGAGTVASVTSEAAAAPAMSLSSISSSETATEITA